MYTIGEPQELLQRMKSLANGGTLGLEGRVEIYRYVESEQNALTGVLVDSYTGRFTVSRLRLGDEGRGSDKLFIRPHKAPKLGAHPITVPTPRSWMPDLSIGQSCLCGFYSDSKYRSRTPKFGGVMKFYPLPPS